MLLLHTLVVALILAKILIVLTWGDMYMDTSGSTYCLLVGFLCFVVSVITGYHSLLYLSMILLAIDVFMNVMDKLAFKNYKRKH
ncbi:membrane protein [Bacillus phage Nachito]|nr:membrane protein [Bacillus phage Nachito]